MSESDYQRGLRGGECRVSISDYERWSDWKAGHDAYEREQDAADEARIMQTLTPAEQRARIKARIKALEIEAVASARVERARRAAERERAHGNAVSQAVLGVILLLGLCLVVGIIAGFILKWIVGIPVFVTFLGSLAIAWWRISVEVVRPYKDGEEKRRKEVDGG
jgi:uncharacterized oligopeptide transporter (OPT) family protein